MASRILPGAVAALLVVVLAFESGGYFPSEWGLAALVAALGAAVVLAVSDEIRIGRPDVVLLGALGLLGAWQLLTIAWSTGAGLPVLEAERTLLYLAAASLLVLVLDASRIPSLLAGLAAGATVVALYALGTRLLPGVMGGAYDPSSGYQLAKPLGYWNALGLLLAMGLALAAGLVLRTSRLPAAAAAVVLVPLTAALYFTFSRGSLVALAVALAVLVLVGADRLRATTLLTVAFAAPLAGVVLASRSRALTTPGATLQTAQAEGNRLAWQLLVLAVAGGALVALCHPAVSRLRVSPAVRRGLAAGALGIAALAVAAGLVRLGGPGAVAERWRGSFAAQAPSAEQGLERRLLSGSGNGRAGYWRVAARMVERDPWLGDGAGSFAIRWARERPTDTDARDAHSLYLETLAELGPVGLLLLVAALGTPLLALWRARDAVPAAPAAAAYAAFLVHAAVDWDWEVPLLVLVALACAVSLVALAPGRTALRLGARGRGLAVTLCGVAVAAAVVAHVGNRAAASALEALLRDDPAAAEKSARRARAWAPWSFEPWQLLGEAQLARGVDAAAVESLRRAVARDPAQWSAWYDLALAARGSERVRALTRARELNPRSIEVSDLAADITRDP